MLQILNVYRCPSTILVIIFMIFGLLAAKDF